MNRPFKYSDETLIVLDEVLSGIVNSSGAEDTKVLKSREGLINRLMTVIDIDECSDFYYVVMEYMNRLIRMQTLNPDLTIELSKTGIKSYLQVNARRLIKVKDVNIEALAQDNGVTFNLNIAEHEQRARNFLFTYCMKKIEELESLKISLIDAMIKLDALYESVMTDYSHYCIHTEAMILEGAVNINREIYSGSEGYFKFLQYAMGKHEQRKSKWMNDKENYLMIESVEEYNKINSKAGEDVYEVAKFNIEPFDEVGSIMAGDIMTLIGDEGTGKTNYMINLATPILMKGNSVIVMCGESKKIKILNMFLSRFIYLTTGYKIHWTELLGDMPNIEDENMRAIIRDCRYKLFEDDSYGKIQLVQKFSYSYYYDEIVKIIRANPDKKFEFVAIDHTDKLDRGEYNASIGALKDGRVSVNALYNWILDLKMQFNLTHLMLAHTGSEAASLIAKGKDVGKRIGATSSATSKDADIVLHLESGPSLEKKKLVKAVFKKFREIDITLFKPVILKKDFSCCNYIYTEELQAELGEQSDKELAISDGDIEELI